MGSTERRARERHATRERILAAARALFVKEGFEAVSMRKIAAAIEYTPAAIYTHFKDKTELLMALGDSDFGLMRDSMRDVEKIADPVERLRACGRAYIRFALEHPHHYRLMFMTSWPYIEPKDCLIEHGNADEDAHAFLCGLVRECIDAGRLRPRYRDAHTTTQACWAAAHGVVSLYITHGSDPWVDFKHPRETAELLLDAAIEGMLSPTPVRGRTPRPRVAKSAPAAKAKRRA